MCMNLESDYVKATVEKIEEIILSDSPDERGGILAFFAEAGQAERAARILEGKGSRALKRAQLYQLHGRLQLEDQRKVFNHDSSERCTYITELYSIICLTRYIDRRAEAGHICHQRGRDFDHCAQYHCRRRFRRL